MPYIYKITNKINNKIYIGKTSHSSIEERFKEHIRDSRKTRYEKRPLYDAMNKYGVENFSIEQIEQVKNDEIASEREQFWIEKLRTYIGFSDCNGYNATLGGDSKRYYNYTEIVKKYLELKSEKEVCEYFSCDPKVVRKACAENGIEIALKTNSKKIRRIDKNGEIKDYASITDAAKDIPNKDPETARKNISRAINRGSLGYNFHWVVLE